MNEAVLSGRLARPGVLARAGVAATLTLSLIACSSAPKTPTAAATSAAATAAPDAAGPGNEFRTLGLNVGTNVLSALPWVQAISGWGPAEINMSNGEAGAGDGHPASINGVGYATALGVHSTSEITYALGGKCQFFTANVGVDDEVGPNGSVNFQVYADGKVLYNSGTMFGGNAAKSFKLDIAGRNLLKLVVTDGGDGNAYDHADWASPLLTGCQTVPLPVTVPAPVYSAPLIIRQGGTYTGAWQSNDPNTPAVQVLTSEPVILQNCYVRGRGDLITANWSSANLTVRGCRGYGMNPNITNRFPGRFFQAEGVSSVVLEDNYLEKTSGIYINSWVGQATTANTIVVRRNQARDIEGRYSDGLGGYQQAFYRVQFLQLNNLKGVPRVDIGWNRIENTPFQSHVEDVISLHASSGTAASPILVHDNLIRGAYPSLAGVTFSGGGIMLGDGGGQYQEARNNAVLETNNYGVAVSNGNDMKVSGNTVLGVGTLPDGTVVNATPDAGIYLRNYSGDPAHRADSVVAQGNTVGWGHPNPGDPGNRIDLSIDPVAGQAFGNTLVAPGAVASALLAQAVTAWETHAAAAGVVTAMLPRSGAQ